MSKMKNTNKSKKVLTLVRKGLREAGYNEAQIANGEKLWRDFYQYMRPNIRKEEIWAAAIEYSIARLEFNEKASQASIAAKYKVGVSTLGAKWQDICDALKLEVFDERYSTVESPFTDMMDLPKDRGSIDRDFWVEEESEGEEFEGCSLKELCEFLIEDIEENCYAMDYLGEQAFNEIEEGNIDEVEYHLNRLLNYYQNVSSQLDNVIYLRSEIYAIMGEICLRYRKDYEKSIEWLKQAVKIHDDFPGGYHLMADAYFELGDYKNAILSWYEEIKRAPMNTYSYLYIADAYEKLGDIEGAKGILKELLDYNPKHIIGLDRLAKYYLQQGNKEKADTLKRQILEVDSPSDIDNIALWTKYNLEAGYLNRVLHLLDNEEKRFPLASMINLLKAVVLLEQGNIHRLKIELGKYKEKVDNRQEFILSGLQKIASIFGVERANRLKERM
jgi:tetratricopeptide (TPR) repeat protein